MPLLNPPERANDMIGPVNGYGGRLDDAPDGGITLFPKEGEVAVKLPPLGTTNEAGLRACVSIIAVYFAVDQLIDAPAFIWVSEIFPTNLRARGTSLGFASYFVACITYTAPGALAFKNIKWNMYFIYMSLCILSTVLVYIYIPETKQVPVEELGALFGDEVIVHLTADGHGIVEQNEMIKTDGLEDVVHVEKA